VGTIIQLQAADGHSFDAYAAQPAGAARGLVVVVPEIFGVNGHIRSVTDGYAADGYLAIAPAMFDRVQRKYESGYTQPEIGAGVEIMKKIGWDQAVADVQAAIDHGKSAGKAGVVGYCWGGAVAWMAAAKAKGLAAAVCYYGGAIPSLVAERPACPVLFHFGETDQSIPLDKAKDVVAKHPEAESYFYPAGHGFNCDHRGSYHEPSAKLARERSVAFFRRHLG